MVNRVILNKLLCLDLYFLIVWKFRENIILDMNYFDSYLKFLPLRKLYHTGTNAIFYSLFINFERERVRGGGAEREREKIPS